MYLFILDITIDRGGSRNFGYRGRENGVAGPTGGSRRSHWQGPAAASAKNTEQFSKLGGLGACPWENFFFIMQNAANRGIFFF